jgi:hypothetical protein
MDESGQSKQAQLANADSDVRAKVDSDIRAKKVDISDDQVHRSRESPSGDTPTTNPDFSVPVLNPAFTQASSPPPPPPPDVQRAARIRELEERLEEATRRIERGAEALERARRIRR